MKSRKVLKIISRGSVSRPAKITRKNIIHYLNTAKKVLEEQNVPPAERWIEIPKSWLTNPIRGLSKEIKRLSKMGLTSEQIAEKIDPDKFSYWPHLKE